MTKPQASTTRSRLGTAVLGAVGFTFLLSACAPLVLGGAAVGTALVASDRRSSGTQLEDQTIEMRASSRIREQLGGRANVYVNSYNRQVLLTGEVQNDAAKTQAQSIVSGVDNVRTIVNELQVINSPGFSQRTSDTLITGRVKAGFVDARDIPTTAVKVTTHNNVVYLMGRVTPKEAERATNVARNVDGVQRVVRVFEVMSEDELKRLAPEPAVQPSSGTMQPPAAPSNASPRN
ncbi:MULTISPECIES: BON domain-containing protein [Hydrogenophaga]|uniref:Transport-associated protein n=1 Tax=Hydrogenophaga intermedia TaxID=65786 RepID=A0A1L1PQ94_HYDIT|nr:MULTISPECIES: BON domain-containing protein [Hydrogenophaga]AOS80827.1 transporter [Hydrogenophaga sp. PBC]TMU72366.1 BON domain-containing protein [Hydrogenophaga intermedia]CDN89869.1 Transport-associated protein [Hydrogenophaga intermedia]